MATHVTDGDTPIKDEVMAGLPPAAADALASASVGKDAAAQDVKRALTRTRASPSAAACPLGADAARPGLLATSKLAMAPSTQALGASSKMASSGSNRDVGGGASSGTGSKKLGALGGGGDASNPYCLALRHVAISKTLTNTDISLNRMTLPDPQARAPPPLCSSPPLCSLPLSALSPSLLISPFLLTSPSLLTSHSPTRRQIRN
ncbi:hypothetical protein T492DRAFT_1122266 [Pavlovales sp. CCMP2436]|nr:hypothetical protein T492DRAFT_1122266 [Pavlovales sp. CCMP2436]